MLACIYRNLIFNQGRQQLASCLLKFKPTSSLKWQARRAFQAAAALKLTVRAQNTIISHNSSRVQCMSANMFSIVCFKYKLQPNPRSVLINSNRVDKRVFLSDLYATVRCANGQSGQLPITQLAYGS